MIEIMSTRDTRRWESSLQLHCPCYYTARVQYHRDFELLPALITISFPLGSIYGSRVPTSRLTAGIAEATPVHRANKRPASLAAAMSLVKFTVFPSMVKIYASPFPFESLKV